MLIVYKTTNQITGKIYIGQHEQKTIEFDGYLGTGLYIKRAIKKYGKENFVRETIEICSSEILDEREHYCRFIHGRTASENIIANCRLQNEKKRNKFMEAKNGI